MDYTVSYRPGSRFGPEAVRSVSVALETYSPEQDDDLERIKCCDLGDLELPFGNVATSLKRIEETARELAGTGKFPLFIGGEHLITYALVKGVLPFYPDLAVVHFDAHADLRREYMGEELSHATVMRHVVEMVGAGNLYQLGIRSGTREEFAAARQVARIYPGQVLEPLAEVLEEVGTRPVYLTLDIDVVDPAFAPGTGTPEPGGCTAREILQAVRTLGRARVVAMDLVEIAPDHDLSGRTALLGAKIIREALLAYV